MHSYAKNDFKINKTPHTQPQTRRYERLTPTLINAL